MSAVLFTGFPGFLGSALLPRTLRRAPGARAVALVQERFADQARATLARIERDDPAVAGRTDLVVGDITVPGLGLPDDEWARLLGGPLEIFHLAAVYDLSVPADLAWRVNVDGTRHVVAFAQAATALRRFQYVSTCYVSGRYDGLFAETDLELGQPFANHYDHTKHEAERVVARARDAGLPVTVYRPSIVVGDSVTGATQKFDGPYYLLQLLARQGATAAVPLPGRAARTEFNLVPSDFVVDAIAALAGHDGALNRTVALAQPDPPTVTRMCEVFADRLGKRLRTVPMPTGLAAFAIDRVPGMGRLFRVPSSTLDYLTHPTRYDVAATTALLGEVGVRCPAFDDHVDAMVTFFQRNPGLGSAAMV
ncbi:SDR family oxidoreductase [Pseudonocardia sp. NPDC046786]|uniref:SDR family oxidoreductase n=1 Tax=Pseudonocardia sp. NPDC046786 TaxID=3155471 RepID=UPI0033E24ED3